MLDGEFFYRIPMKKLFAAFALLVITSAAADEGQFSLATGFDQSSGKYGNVATTSIFSIPVTAKYETDDWTFDVTVPYIRMDSPGGVVRGMGRIGRATTTTKRTTVSGLGDITTSADYSVFADDDFMLDVAGNVKLGTANAKNGLGTGKNDYSGEVDAYYTIKGTTLSSMLGYKIYGAPTGSVFNNAPYVSLGVMQKFNEHTSAGVMFDAEKSHSTFSSGPRDVTLYLSQKITPAVQLQLNILKGYSNGSPDSGFGATITGQL